MKTAVVNWLGGAACLAAGGTAWAVWRRRNRISFRGGVVLITGGSRGLGLCLARRLGAEGANLVLVARDRRELRLAEAELRGEGVEVMGIQCDVGDGSQVEAAVEKTIARFGCIDVLINNAGIIQVGPLDHMGPEDFDQAMRVHFQGPLNFMLATLPHMRKAGGGRIVNVGSIGGRIAAPHLVPYSASKFALTGLSDGMRAELRRDGILVTTVTPGLMRTGSPPNAEFKGRHREEYAWFTVADSLPLLSMSGDRAARKIIEACRAGSPCIVLGAPAKAAVLLGELFPGMTARASSWMHSHLPEADEVQSRRAYSGWESESRWAPSFWTRATYAAARRNNEAAAVGRRGGWPAAEARR